jgi:hypothetical protein
MYSLANLNQLLLSLEADVFSNEFIPASIINIMSKVLEYISCIYLLGISCTGPSTNSFINQYSRFRSLRCLARHPVMCYINTRADHLIVWHFPSIAITLAWYQRAIFPKTLDKP